MPGVALWSAMTLRYAWVCDDAYISFRYARNLVRGEGLRYNLGEHPPVEGYSDLLWVLLAAVPIQLGLDPARPMQLLLAACGLGVLLMVFSVLRQAEAPPAVAGVAVLALGTLPPFAVWSTSGLEPMAQTFAMLYLFRALVMREGAGWDVWVAAACLTLVRTEGVAWVAVIAGAGGVGALFAGRRPSWRSLAGVLAVAAAVALAQLAFRLGYHEDWIANTARIKVHMSASTLERGVRYVLLFLTTVGTPVVMALMSVRALAHKRRGLAAASLFVVVAVHGYAIAVSGDYMAWFRLLVPALPFLALGTGLALHLGWQRRPSQRRVFLLAGALIGGANLLAASGYAPTPRRFRADLDIREKTRNFRNENHQWHFMVRNVQDWLRMGGALARYAEGDPDADLVVGAIGALGWASDLTLHDRFGLVDREVASLPDPGGKLRSPGHDRIVERTWFVPRNPRFLGAWTVDAPHWDARPAKLRGTVRASGAHMVRYTYAPVLATVSVEGDDVALLLIERMPDADAAKQAWTRFGQAASERMK